MTCGNRRYRRKKHHSYTDKARFHDFARIGECRVAPSIPRSVEGFQDDLIDHAWIYCNHGLLNDTGPSGLAIWATVGDLM